MKMSFRWFGTGHDSVSLKNIRQIPGMKGVITTLYDVPVGDEWSKERIQAMNKEVKGAGLEIYGIESVNIHDSIKIGLPERDKYIERYINTIKNLSNEGINLVCYNFMPVFDWTRTDLAKLRTDGSTVLAYDQKVIDKIHPENIFESFEGSTNGFQLPGWEPERMAKVKELFQMYEDVDNEKLFENLTYFLNAIMPTCEKYGVKMAIHPDDPGWSVFGLPRIIINQEAILRMLKKVDNSYNGVTLCTGSLGSNPNNNIPDIIRSMEGRIHFAHIRNMKHESEGKFEEAAHLSSDGSLDLFEIVKAFYDIGFDGPARPDHGRMIWDEVAMPGYGLYDRALGSQYIQGLWEAIDKMSN